MFPFLELSAFSVLAQGLSTESGGICHRRFRYLTPNRIRRFP